MHTCPAPASTRPVAQAAAGRATSVDAAEVPAVEAVAYRPGETCLNVAARAFLGLTKDNDAMSVDGRAIGHGLPPRMINLRDLRSILLKPSTSFETRDAAWRHLVTLARGGDPAWAVAATGVALPALRRAAARLAAMFPTARQDIDGELLTGFLAALQAVDIDAPRVITRLMSPAYTIARRYRDAELSASRQATGGDMACPQTLNTGSDEYEVLARAVLLGVITEYQAEVIASTRLGGMSLAEYAAVKGRTVNAVNVARNEGERTLKKAIDSGALPPIGDNDAEVILEATTTVF